jgi:hypothetical protein
MPAGKLTFGAFVTANFAAYALDFKVAELEG